MSGVFAKAHPPPRVKKDGDRYIATLPATFDYKTVFGERIGEVAMVIQRTEGWLLLQSKRSYPPGLFRIPTGTIETDDQSAETTMRRELHEEANLAPDAFSRLFRLDYQIGDAAVDFYTVGYVIDAHQGQLKPNDPEEAISAWREAQLSELPTVAEELRRLDGTWRPWGLFRAASHQLYYTLLGEPT